MEGIAAGKTRRKMISAWLEAVGLFAFSNFPLSHEKLMIPET
jgi:hypothetical protein